MVSHTTEAWNLAEAMYTDRGVGRPLDTSLLTELAQSY